MMVRKQPIRFGVHLGRTPVIFTVDCDFFM